MTIRKRLNHTSTFKVNVAPEALKGEYTLAELAGRYDLHSKQIQCWNKMLTDGAVDLFGTGEKDRKDTEAEIDKLHSKIGQLTMERDSLAEKRLGVE